VTRTLNLFYEEPNPDRWMPLDRYPRQVARRLIRGRPPIGGVQRLFVNLPAGLELLGAPVRVNAYRYAARHPDEVLDQRRWENPILFGPVALGGDFPFRAMEAADLYRRGWASKVWLTRPGHPEQDQALARLGLPQAEGEARGNADVLDRLGVPAGVVRVLPERVLNTAGEVGAVARAPGRQGGSVAILVTSKPHSRRVRATWTAVVGSRLGAVVRYPAADPFDAVG
jgi:uncharacterized SAM-binding protein YcdF (DUF218 family)